MIKSKTGNKIIMLKLYNIIIDYQEQVDRVQSMFHCSSGDAWSSILGAGYQIDMVAKMSPTRGGSGLRLFCEPKNIYIDVDPKSVLRRKTRNPV